MKSRRRAEMTEAQRETIAGLLRKANGRRTTRLLSMPEIERCMESALGSELGFAWASAGDAPDARAVTSVCLAVVAGDQLTVGVAPAHGAATPASAWADLPAWDRYRDSANAAPCRAWAGRPRADRVSSSLGIPATPTAATSEELLAAVMARPDDDAPRLVYADWLSERGDPRGEFISIQCAPPSEDLESREAELLSAHSRQWLGGLGDDVLQATFRRGFVEQVTMRDARALLDAQALLEREPVTEVVFASARLLDVERLASLEWLERLRSLSFQGAASLGLHGLTPLLKSRRLRKLTTLGFESQRLGDEGARLLAAEGGTTFPTLERLSLDDDTITERGASPLAASRWATRFTALSLTDNQLGAEGVEVLAEVRSPGRLVHLALGGNQLRDSGAIVIAQSRRFQTLRTLSLPRDRIGPIGAEALFESPWLSQLTSLDLSGNPVGSAGRKRLQARFAR